MELIKMHKGKPMEDKDYGLVLGMVPALVMESDKPDIKWGGAKFPRNLYMQTVAFAKWCAEEYGGEVQGRLYYSESRDRWRMVVMPQYISRNMASKEIEKHDKRVEALLIVSKSDWKQNGTWHSHVFGGAGQSPTDYNDEIKQPGFHYTVGSMRSKLTTFHCRYTFRGLMYELDNDCILKNPCVDPEKCISFPHAWKDMLIEDKRVKPAVAMGSGFSMGRGHINYCGVDMTKAEWDEFVQSGDYRKDCDRRKDERMLNQMTEEDLIRIQGSYDPNHFTDEFTDAELIQTMKDAYGGSYEIIEAFALLAKNISNFDSFEDSINDMAKLIAETNEDNIIQEGFGF